MATIQFSGDFAALYSKFIEVGSNPYYKTFGSTRAVMAEKNGSGSLGIGAVFEGDLTPTFFTGTIDWFGSAWIGNTPNDPGLEYDFVVAGLSIASSGILKQADNGAPFLDPEGLRLALAGTGFVATGTDVDDVFGPIKGLRLTGDDTIRGLIGHDTLSGGKGDDRIYGGVFNDRLFGNMGEDHLFGGGHKDELFGGHGNDVLKGGKDRDTLIGGFGDDILSGQKGSDVLNGGPGDDILRGGKGDDTLSGGRGSDNFVFVSGKTNGDDTVTDFRRAVDKLKFHGPVTFDDLTINQVNSDTIVSWNNGSVTLEGVTAQVDADHFLFV